ncbi:BTAD domain-containing putative transcriptional regulator [Rugosimonospora acidiphila]|uniref:BTAD domain-containing putative transcriptional regulator n=1 Tax=Rugosimonospora acidiphila TaxID=556531 RepID=A0ABP9SCF9_9ACTN
MSARQPDLWCTLFGGVRAWREDIELTLGPPKQRATLGLLLAAGGQPVTVGQLIGALWDDEPAASAVNQIHRYIGTLRRIFEPAIARRAVGQWLLPVGAGYRLAAPNDLQRFRSLVADAHRSAPPESTTLLVEALRLAAAPPGDEPLRGLPLMVAVEDERVRAAVLAAQHGIRCGMAADVVPGVRGVAAEHPLDEPLQAALIRCLHAAGRSAEALTVYGQTRDRLRDELGADPGPELANAYRAALTSTPAAPVTAVPTVRDPAPAPAQLPAAPPAFAGRAAALVAIGDDGGPVSVISGMAGVGKTTLALHWAHTHAADFPDGQLYVNLRGFDATGRPAEPNDALRDLLQSLGVAPATLPDEAEARGALLRTLLASRRLVIVLDNARDARQVEPLLPGRTDSRVIVTSRNRLASLVARASANLVNLEPFTGDEAAQFLTKRLGPARARGAPRALERLHDACGGLPLALAIVAARGVLNPVFPLDLLASEMTNSVAPLDLLVDDDQEVDLREVLTWSYRALTPDAATALHALAIHPGPDISLAAAVSLTALPAARTRTALTALTAASLLRETAPGRFAYHDLVRRYALEQAATDLVETTTRLLAHYLHSTRTACLQYGRPPLVALPPPAGGVVPESPTGPTDAVHWYQRERAVLQSIVRRAADQGDSWTVLLITQDWRPMSDNIDAPRDLLPYVRLALDAASAVEKHTGGDVPLALIAECHRDAAAKFARSGDLDTARSHYDTALRGFERLGDLTGQANTLRNMAVTLARDPQERMDLAARAVQAARGCGVPLVLCTALSAYGQMQRMAGRPRDAFPAFLEGLALSGQYPGGENLAPQLLAELARNHAAIGDVADAVAFGERALEAARHVNDLMNEVGLLAEHGDALLATGHPSRARRAWQRYLDLSANSGIADSVAHEVGRPAADTARYVRAKLAALPPED